ncbi:hypothetical protein, partial [Microbacterium thalli]
ATDDHTRLSTRHDASDADHTRLSTRHGAPEADHTVLSARHEPADDEHTRLSSRATEADEPGPAAVPSAAPVEADDSVGRAEPETVWVRRQAKDRIVRGRLDTARQASVPEGGGERYRVREAVAPTPVVRTRVDAPVRQASGAPARRRSRGTATIIAVVGGGVLVLGAAATAATILIGGAP